MATEQQVNTMKENYLAGGFGYGHAKQALFELVLERFATERSAYDHLMANKHLIDDALQLGASKATLVANTVLQRVRGKVGY